MAPRKSTPAAEAEPVAETTEATTPSDEEVQAAIDAAIEENRQRYAEANANRSVSVTELYDQFTELVLDKVRGSHRHTAFRTEQSAIRVLELALGWAMNNRQDQSPSIPMMEIGEEGELVGPAPDEILDTESTTEEAA